MTPPPRTPPRESLTLDRRARRVDLLLELALERNRSLAQLAPHQSRRIELLDPGYMMRDYFEGGSRERDRCS